MILWIQYINYFNIQYLIGERISFIGTPKTIDNDLVITDHTPEFRREQNMLLHL